MEIQKKLFPVALQGVSFSYNGIMFPYLYDVMFQERSGRCTWVGCSSVKLLR